MTTLAHGWFHTDDTDPGTVLPAAVFLDNGGRAQGERSPLRMCRLADKGNPSPGDLIPRVLAEQARGNFVLLLNERNNPHEGAAGGPGAYRELFQAVAPHVNRDMLVWAPPSPGFEGFEQWYPPANYTGLAAINAYGEFGWMTGTVAAAMKAAPLARWWVVEYNPGWGRGGVNLDAWAWDSGKPFLDWLALQPNVVAATYFALHWNGPDSPGPAFHGRGTQVQRMLNTYQPKATPAPAPAPAPQPPKGAPTMQYQYNQTFHWQERNGRKVEAVIIHTTEGNSTFQNATKYLVQNARKVSAHRLIGDEHIIVFLDDARASNGAGAESARLPSGAAGNEVNLRTFNIELYNTEGRTPSPAIIAAGAEEAAKAIARFGLRPSAVLGHREVDGTRRTDPTGVDMKEFRARVQHLMAQPHLLDDWDKAVYWVEHAARLARDEGDTRAHQTIVGGILPSAYAIRDR